MSPVTPEQLLRGRTENFRVEVLDVPLLNRDLVDDSLLSGG